MKEKEEKERRRKNKKKYLDLVAVCLLRKRRRRRKDREKERDNNNDKKVWTGGSAELAEGLQMVLRTSFYFLIYSFARSLLDVVGGGGWGAGDEAGLIALNCKGF